MLVLLVIQTSGDLRMMEHYAAPLLNVSKADENNAKLQGELATLLQPTKHFNIRQTSSPVIFKKAMFFSKALKAFNNFGKCKCLHI